MRKDTMEALNKGMKSEDRFARNLAFWIKTNDMSLRDAAKQLGVHQSLLTRYMAGEAHPHFGALKMFCLRTGLSADYLMGFSGKPYRDKYNVGAIWSYPTPEKKLKSKYNREVNE